LAELARDHLAQTKKKAGYRQDRALREGKSEIKLGAGWNWVQQLGQVVG
jgi:hypothetical protein